ncbi:hypothetical protein [Halorubrum coriense]|nr:hypothetical protein [Halorubrum coriense]
MTVRIGDDGEVASAAESATARGTEADESATAPGAEADGSVSDATETG